MRSRIIFGVLLASALAVAPASAQQKPVRVRGTVEQVDGSVLMVKTREGDTLKVKLADDAKVFALVKASSSDIKSGSYVGATAMPAAGGAWDAVEVHIFPEAMRGTGMGDRPFDYKPKSTMTNGTVKAGGGSDAVGAVAKMQGPTIAIDYKDGVKDVRLTPDTVIVSYAPGSKDELKSGAKIFIPAATRQRDGSLMTARVNVGRGVTPPM